jgi:hypothetical protein
MHLENGDTKVAQKKSGKRREGASGVKALIAIASVAGTLAGWAVLPSNDPSPTAAANDQVSQQTAISTPATTETGSVGTSAQVIELPTATPIPTSTPTPADTVLPQIAVPSSTSRWPAPFTGTHSSR